MTNFFKRENILRYSVQIPFYQVYPKPQTHVIRYIRYSRKGLGFRAFVVALGVETSSTTVTGVLKDRSCDGQDCGLPWVLGV